MIQIDALKEMLDLDEEELKQLSDEKLQLLLGCVNFASRVVTREVNRRNEESGVL